MSTIAELNTALDGRYHVERQIGIGGMATVYLAQICDTVFALLALHWPPLARVRAEPEYGEILRGIGWGRPFEAPALPIDRVA